jgi:hypothetical protein
VRRMQAMVGQEVPFDHGRQQIRLLADLEVTAKGVERTAEAVGEDIALQEQREIHRAVQLDQWWESRFRSCTWKWTAPECRR